jgi:hypothetical protein
MSKKPPSRNSIISSIDPVQEFRNKITLNVGGVKFTTTKGTLVAESGTYFDTLIKSGSWAEDEDGEFFIDRNPRFFPAILDYLRMLANGKDAVLLVGSISPEEQRLLDDDIEYYLIGSLRRILISAETTGWKLDTRCMGSNLTMSEDCLTVTKTGESGNRNSGVIGTHGFYEGTYKWRLILDAKEHFWIFFGVSPVCYQDHPINRSGKAIFCKPGAIVFSISHRGLRSDVRGWSTGGYSWPGGACDAPKLWTKGTLTVEMEFRSANTEVERRRQKDRDGETERQRQRQDVWRDREAARHLKEAVLFHEEGDDRCI